MKELETITELARLFRVAPSALRYWDNKGLLRFERGRENNYRVPTFQTMMDICEVLLLRDCAIPIKEIRRLPRLDARGIGGVLEQNGRALERKKQELEEAMEKIRRKQILLERMEELRRQPLEVCTERLPAVTPFFFHDGKAVRRFVQDSSQSAIVFDPIGGEGPRYGLCAADGEEEKLLRPADSQDTPYLTGLLKLASDTPSVTNAASFVSEARQRGFRPGVLVGRYLLSACEDGVRYDYYEAYLELDEK